MSVLLLAAVAGCGGGGRAGVYTPPGTDAGGGQCGAQGEPCCAGQCNLTLTCQFGLCQPMAAKGTPGSPCSGPTDCASGVCRPVGQPSTPPWTGSVCTAACATDATCPAGWSCGGTPRTCTCSFVPETCDGRDNDCDGTVDGAAADADCARGMAGAECVAGTCLVMEVTSAHGSYYRYVVNHIGSPLRRSDYAIDLNGDSLKDNQLGNILGAMTAQGFDVQSALDAGVEQGQALLLVRLQTADATLRTDATAGATLYHARQTVPDFSGSGTFTIDASFTPSDFLGRLAAASFRSNSPVATARPVDAVVPMVFGLLEPGAVVSMPIHGAHIQFTTGTDPASGAPGLLTGEIHGSIKRAEVDSYLVPSIAAAFTEQIRRDPTSAASRQLQQIFDSGGCGTSRALDGRIDPCEVSENNIIQNVLAPDVQIYDAAGRYAPNPANANKDSLSVGMGFTAVRASF